MVMTLFFNVKFNEKGKINWGKNWGSKQGQGLKTPMVPILFLLHCAILYIGI